jgi:di/tricarboxylate transporter
MERMSGFRHLMPQSTVNLHPLNLLRYASDFASFRYIFSQMFSPTIMLLIGGFTIAAVLSKTRLDIMVATRVLNAAGSKPSTVLLCLMLVATFASMWISNVAAPTLCYALIKVSHLSYLKTGRST